MRKRNKKSRPSRQGDTRTLGRKQLSIERLEQRQLLAGDLFYTLGTFALPGPTGQLPADTSGFGGESATEVAEVVSQEDFANRADGMGDRAAAPQTGRDNAAILAAGRIYDRPGFGQMATTTPNRGLQPAGNGSWDQLQRGVEHRISNPADRYAHLTDPLAGYGTEGSNGYGHGEDDLYAGNAYHIPGSIGGSFHWEPIPGSADAYLRDQLAEGQAWMDAHENGNPSDAVSDKPKAKTTPANGGTGVVTQDTKIPGSGGLTFSQVATLLSSGSSSQQLVQTHSGGHLKKDGTLEVQTDTIVISPAAMVDQPQPADPQRKPGQTPKAIVVEIKSEGMFGQRCSKKVYIVGVEPIGGEQACKSGNTNPSDPERQDDPDAPPPPDMNDDVPPPPEEGNVDPLPGEKTPKIGVAPENPGNPPQDAGVVDPPKDSHQRKHAKSPIPTGPLADNFLDAVDPPNPMAD